MSESSKILAFSAKV